MQDKAADHGVEAAGQRRRDERDRREDTQDGVQVGVRRQTRTILLATRGQTILDRLDATG